MNSLNAQLPIAVGIILFYEKLTENSAQTLAIRDETLSIRFETLAIR